MNCYHLSVKLMAFIHYLSFIIHNKWAEVHLVLYATVLFSRSIWYFVFFDFVFNGWNIGSLNHSHIIIWKFTSPIHGGEQFLNSSQHPPWETQHCHICLRQLHCIAVQYVCMDSDVLCSGWKVYNHEFCIVYIYYI